MIRSEVEKMNLRKESFLLLCFLLSFPERKAVSNNFEIQQDLITEQHILAEIIKNYIIKYFSGDQTSLSMISAPSAELIHYDLLKLLLDYKTFAEFPHNILSYLDNVVRGSSVFNLIFIDGSKSIS